MTANMVDVLPNFISKSITLFRQSWLTSMEWSRQMKFYISCWKPANLSSMIWYLWMIPLYSLTLTLRLRQNGCHFADNTFKCIFLNVNVRISIKISLKFVPKGPINNIPALVQIMAWRRPGDKPLFEPIMVRLPMHIWVTRPQSVNQWWLNSVRHICITASLNALM